MGKEGRYSMKRFDSRRSGETYRNLQLLSMTTLSVLITSFLFIPACMEKAVIPFFLKFSTWSFINAINGLTTRQRPSLAIAGTWKQIDFPPPVGNSAKVSSPPRTELIMSSCRGLKFSCPQYCFNICWMEFNAGDNDNLLIYVKRLFNEFYIQLNIMCVFLRIIWYPHVIL